MSFSCSCTQFAPKSTTGRRIFNSFINKKDGLGPNQFKGVHMNYYSIVADLLTLNILLYDIDFVDGNNIAKLARRSVQRYVNSVRMLRYNISICYVSNINAVFQYFRCPNCDTFFSRTFNFEQNLTTCSERVKNVYLRNVYQIRETTFDTLDSFGIKYTSQHKLFKNLAIFDFESICGNEESFKDTKTTTWIGKQIPIWVSNSSNLGEESIFLYNSDPHHLVLSFIGALEGLASQSKAKMKLIFLDVETTIKIKLGSTLDKFSQRHNRREPARFDMSQDDCDNENCASTQFIQIKKTNLMIFKNLWNVIAMFYLCLVSTVQNTIST